MVKLITSPNNFSMWTIKVVEEGVEVYGLGTTTVVREGEELEVIVKKSLFDEERVVASIHLEGLTKEEMVEKLTKMQEEVINDPIPFYSNPAIKEPANLEEVEEVEKEEEGFGLGEFLAGWLNLGGEILGDFTSFPNIPNQTIEVVDVTPSDIERFQESGDANELEDSLYPGVLDL